MKNNVILIGYMGCGKSTIGKKLSKVLGYEFIDTDQLIEEREERTISTIFKNEGEDYFRNLETKVIKEMIGSSREKVISVGGGLPLREENRTILRKLGIVLYLKAKADTIYERIRNDTTRPLLQTKNPKETIINMINQREEIYREAAADIIIVDKKSVNDVIEEIIMKLKTER